MDKPSGATPCSGIHLCRSGRSGQAYVETALAVMLVSFIFLGLFQLSQIFAAREILFHAAHRAARARTVGFNRWMVNKSMRAAAIPVSGRMLEPEVEREAGSPVVQAIATRSHGDLWDYALTAWPASGQAAIERARIPLYLGSDSYALARNTLDYEGWNDLTLSHSGYGLIGGDYSGTTFETRVSKRFPLRVAMSRAFYAPGRGRNGEDRISLTGRARIESHYPLYIDDRGW